MLPIGDDNRYRRITPPVTYALIVLNIFVFLLELSGGVPFIVHWSVVPQRLLANPFGDFRTIFTAMFLHAGWLHLLGNMLYLCRRPFRTPQIFALLPHLWDCGDFDPTVL